MEFLTVESWEENKGSETDNGANDTCDTVNSLPQRVKLELHLNVNFGSQQEYKKAFIKCLNWSVPKVRFPNFMCLLNETIAIILETTCY
jgi:hypothetical protein